MTHHFMPHRPDLGPQTRRTCKNLDPFGHTWLLGHSVEKLAQRKYSDASARTSPHDMSAQPTFKASFDPERLLASS
jgi:hypothetical protein